MKIVARPILSFAKLHTILHSPCMSCSVTSPQSYASHRDTAGVRSVYAEQLTESEMVHLKKSEERYKYARIYHSLSSCYCDHRFRFYGYRLVILTDFIPLSAQL